MNNNQKKTDMYENIKLYLENLKTSDYAESTIINYEIHLRNFFSYCHQQEVNYREIRAKEMLTYKIIISERYSFQSVNAKLSVINSFYDFLIDLEEVKINPIRPSMYVRKNRKDPKPLDPFEEKFFLEWLQTKEKHIELGFKILFDTGIRISELVRLRKEDIRIIENKVFLFITESKNKKERLVPVFSENVITELMKHAEGNFDNTLFYFTTRAYQQHAEEFSKKFDIKFTTQMARHTFATRKLNEGMRIDILQKILGHADIRTTMYYAKTNDSEILKLGGVYNN